MKTKEVEALLNWIRINKQGDPPVVDFYGIEQLILRLAWGPPPKFGPSPDQGGNWKS